MAHITDYIRKLIRTQLPVVELKEDEMLLEATLKLEPAPDGGYMVSVKDKLGNDVTEISGVNINKEDSITLNGIYIIFKIDKF